MPRGLTARIVLAFLGVALVAWLAIGATLFLLLRNLHSATIGGRLEDQATTLAAQARQAVLTGDAQSILGAIRAELSDAGTLAYVVTADGRVVGLTGAPAPPAGTFAVDPGGRSATNHGSAVLPDGMTYAYGVLILRPAAVAGPRALVVATPDRSARDALGDLLAAIPAVIVVTLLVGGPIAWFVARSVGAPLRRLAAATATVQTARPAALPLEGPTEVRELIGRFNAMTATLAETRERETELLANLRHDLRTPLTVIGGFAGALADGTATGEDAGRAAHAIVDESGRLGRLVDELGAIERLRTGAAGLRPERVDGRTALRETAARFGPAAAAAGIEILVVSEPADGAEDLRFVADRLAVDRMLGNLVSNALASIAGTEDPAVGGGGPAGAAGGTVGAGGRSTGATAAAGATGALRGHVWLDGRAVPAGTPGDGGSVALSVIDDGPGFPPGTADRAFERFFRADPARSGGGSGLGLAIVRELAEAHGGSAHAEHVAPRGARVSVVLPRSPRLSGLDA